MQNHRFLKLSVLTAAAMVVLAAGSTPPVIAASNAPNATAPAGEVANPTGGDAAHWGLLEQRCTKCHNSTDWAGGVAFDTMTADSIPADAETWRKRFANCVAG